MGATPQDLRDEIRQLRERLARLEELQRRQDDDASREFRRERDAAIAQAERMSTLLSRTDG